ncbi:HD domain-containing protein [Amycolatopsis sp. GM8]|uniref:HD domain-containing protein n=1 Tax=Amycolatopsis sp. GM8 TaxID=2896530 RepID=UPI001F41F9ED|nr:HD domain-containing protein [Amycolatopsis sp. GM8]
MWFSVPDTLAVLRAMAGDYDGGEAVDQLQHALQTAGHALTAEADIEVVVAALLHDVGRAPGVVEHYRGLPHEQAGADFCLRHCGERAAFLVGQHVPAKRYLVVVDAGYAESLSPVSQRSLVRQGGPMTPEEVAEFEAHPWAREAAELRRWDDAAKVPGVPTRPLESFEPLLHQLWR